MAARRPHVNAARDRDRVATSRIPGLTAYVAAYRMACWAGRSFAAAAQIADRARQAEVADQCVPIPSQATRDPRLRWPYTLGAEFVRDTLDSFADDATCGDVTPDTPEGGRFELTFDDGTRWRVSVYPIWD